MQSHEAYLIDDAFFTDPYPVYAQLRETAPIYWSEAWGTWLVTRYADVVRVLSDSDAFSSAGRVRYLLDQLPPEGDEFRRVLAAHYDVGLAHTDPPAHTRLRRLLSRGFTPRMVAAWRDRIEATVAELVARVRSRASFDVVADIAYPLPATILAEMIGAPSADIARFRDWAIGINRLFEKGGRVTLAAAEAAYTSRMEMAAYIADLAAERRAAPRDDVMSALVSAEADDRLTDAELVSTLVTLFVAGHETTTNLIANGVYTLLRHPQQLALLRGEPELIDAAVEEMLRYEPSVPRSWRIARHELELGGQTIAAGDLVFPIIAAANRDPAVFDAPDRFDIRRRPNKHLAFGHGIHYCIGAPLARLEASIAIQAIAAAFPGLRLAAKPLHWYPDVAIRRLTALPVDR